MSFSTNAICKSHDLVKSPEKIGKKTIPQLHSGQVKPTPHLNAMEMPAQNTKSSSVVFSSPRVYGEHIILKKPKQIQNETELIRRRKEKTTQEPVER